MAKPLPTRADLVEYNHAVAGHDGTLSDVDGELFIKPCTQAEINFYEASVSDHTDFADFMPTYLGTLSLDDGAASGQEQGKSLGANGAADLDLLPIAKQLLAKIEAPIKIQKRIVTHQAVVLENAAHGFVKPNILDCKLGVRLWSDDAAEEKKMRFDKITAETTHKDLGFRIAGMKVWQGDGASGDDIDDEGFKVYDKNYGRYHVQKDNIVEAFENFAFCKSAGIDEELGQLVCQAFLADILRIQEVMEAQESRMVSSSLLLIFEGDGAALRAAMEEASNPTPAVAVNGNGTRISAEDDEDSEEDEPSGPKIYSVKVIDFAHAEWVPGMGPDENSLKGVRSVAHILTKLSSNVEADS